jgi:hypothetical protein
MAAYTGRFATLALPHLHHDRIDEDRHVHRIQRTM